MILAAFRMDSLFNILTSVPRARWVSLLLLLTVIRMMMLFILWFRVDVVVVRPLATRAWGFGPTVGLLTVNGRLGRAMALMFGLVVKMTFELGVFRCMAVWMMVLRAMLGLLLVLPAIVVTVVMMVLFLWLSCLVARVNVGACLRGSLTAMGLGNLLAMRVI